MLGIKLQIDKGSAKEAGKIINKGMGKGAKKVSGRLGLGTIAGAAVGAEIGEKEAGSKDKGKKKEGSSALVGGLLGGLIGALIGSLKPIRELLDVVAGILQLFLVPVLMLLKPFLVLFLKVGIALLKLVSGGGDLAGNIKTILAVVLGIIATIFAVILAPFELGAAAIAGILLVLIVAFYYLLDFFQWAGKMLWEGMKWLWENAMVPAWEWLVEKIKILWTYLAAAFTVAWEWMKTASAKVWGWLVQGFKEVLNFGADIWKLFLTGLSTIANLGNMLWDWFKTALRGIADLGTKLWNYIKSAIGSFFGFGSTSVDDALVTSSGQIVKLNPNDNVLAFQDFSQVQNVAGAAGGARGNIIINVEGFVGSEQDLAEKVSKALSKMGRGTTSNFN